MSDDLSIRPPEPTRGSLPLVPSAGVPGDDDRMAAITTQLYPRLLAWAHSLVRAGEGDDVVQDALLRFWRREMRRPAHEANPNPSATLMQLVHDVAREQTRDTSRRDGTLKRLRGSVTAYVATHISSPFISGERHWMTPGRERERREIDPAIAAAIDALPRRQREVFILVAGHELSFEEAGATLKLGASTVRAHYARANDKLRDMLGGRTASGRPRGVSGAPVQALVHAGARPQEES
ncbi:MAG: RNA polymerase sigma factor [Gemmatimonadetes bacterium]|nr:RNA polymerase sigma factor [Gemmatimonadota bacterium]